MTHPHDREFFRLQYPQQAAPKFTMDGVVHRIVDIGEGGFRYAVAENGAVVGRTVKGVIEFEDYDPLEIEGEVVRMQAGEVAIRCAPPAIPLALVIREQQRVRRRYPFRGVP